MITIKSIHDLNILIVSKLEVLSKLDIDIIVGVPRSGLMTATIIATHLQKPVTDIYSYVSGRGLAESGRKIDIDSNKKLNVLLVDDTINTGKSMRDALSIINKVPTSHNIIKFCVYISPKTNLKDVDVYLENCPHPRAFQWNLWRHGYLKNWATDMDGVLCRDPIWIKENDRGPKLIQFYKNVEKKFTPKKTIKYIITARLEKHRQVTEQWLSSNNIKYQKLIMKPESGDYKHAMYKSEVINSLNDIELYIESSVEQSKIISKNVRIPIWCVDNQSVYYPK